MKLAVTDTVEKDARSEGLSVQQFLTFRISRVHAKLNAQASHILKTECGLSLAQWRIIALLAGSGETSPKWLCRKASIDKGLLSRKLKQLSDSGLVTVRQDEHDQRQQVISLTEDGRTVFQQMLPTMRRRQAHLLADLTAEEEALLFRALEKVSVAAERRDFSE